MLAATLSSAHGYLFIHIIGNVMSVNLNVLKQTFNSPKVNLEITSFKSQKYWENVIKQRDYKDIWDLINWIAPSELFNIFNFHLIEKRFTTTPTRERIIRLLREHDFYAVVKLNLHDPFKGYSIVIHESLEAAKSYTHKRPVSMKIVKGTNSFILQDYIDPLVEKTSALLNNFTFCEEFANYIALGNANMGQRTFICESENGVETDKQWMGIHRKINWRGISFELTDPVKDRSKSKYYVIEDMVRHLRKDTSFFDVFRKVNHLVNQYVTAANNDANRIMLSERYTPIAYNDSEKLMKELRLRRILLEIDHRDFDRCFTPYLEIGENINEFIMGVVSR